MTWTVKLCGGPADGAERQQDEVPLPSVRVLERAVTGEYRRGPLREAEDQVVTYHWRAGIRPTTARTIPGGVARASLTGTVGTGSSELKHAATRSQVTSHRPLSGDRGRCASLPMVPSSHTTGVVFCALGAGALVVLGLFEWLAWHARPKML